ncbi:MAG: GxxExxY protein [Anaerolineae bacterium]|nr:GxxExxY protein [Anaerolineae bacterium]
MPDKRVLTPYDDLTYTIIGCAMAVHRQLGPGHKEDVYHRDLKVRLDDGGLVYEWEKHIEVYDTTEGRELIGLYIPDFIVAGKIVVELKALSELDNSHIAQVIAYLAATDCPLGLLLNFGTRSLQFKRVFPPTNIHEHRVNRQWLFVPDWLKQ